MQHIGLISDEAMFRAREYITADRRFPDKNNSPRAELGGVLSCTGGRYRFWVHPTKTAVVRSNAGDFDPAVETFDREYVTLRIDGKNRIISGDLHSDIARKIWKFSWQSEALFTINCPEEIEENHWRDSGWDLFGICDVFDEDTSKLTGSSNKDPSKCLAIALRFDKKFRNHIAAIRIIQSNSEGDILLDLMGTDSDARYNKSIRYFKPIHLADSQSFNEYGPLINSALGERAERVGNLLRKNRIFWDQRKADEAPFDFSLIPVDDGSPFRQLAPYQWSDDPYTFVILFSSKHDRSYGTVPNLDRSKYPLSKVRAGAIVFVDKIIEEYKKKEKARNGGGEIFWQEEPHRTEIERIINRTYVHELGHLLNLPHTWQRGQFPSPPLPSNPAARTWMAYGSRFPLGDFMITSRKKLTDGDEEEMEVLKQEDSRIATEDALRDVTFSDTEERWIWHAPFDHVSPGGPYFSQKPRAPLTLHSPTDVSDFELKLEIDDYHGKVADPAILLEKGKREDKIEDKYKDVYVLVRGAHSEFPWQVIFGNVSFEAKRSFVDSNDFHFSFQTPMLSLLIREEFPWERNRHKPRLVREVPVDKIPFDWKVRQKNGDLKLTKFVRDFHQRVLKPKTINSRKHHGEDRLKFFQTLPFINMFDFSKNYTRETKNRDFTIQVVLRPIDHNPIYSNLVKIRFRNISMKYTEEEVRILTHDKFPLYLTMISYLGRYDIVRLAARDPHTGEYSEDVFRGLAESIDRLNSSNVSPKLFEFLKETEAVRQKVFERNDSEIPRPSEANIVRLEEFIRENSDVFDVPWLENLRENNDVQ